MTILRELRTKEEQLSEVRTTYQYVLDLSKKLEDTCKFAGKSLVNLRNVLVSNLTRRQSHEASKQVILYYSCYLNIVYRS